MLALPLGQYSVMPESGSLITDEFSAHREFRPHPCLGVYSLFYQKLPKNRFLGARRFCLSHLSMRVFCFWKSDEKWRFYGPNDVNLLLDVALVFSYQNLVKFQLFLDLLALFDRKSLVTGNIRRTCQKLIKQGFDFEKWSKIERMPVNSQATHFQQI